MHTQPGNILIVGASSGMGLLTAQHFVAMGWRVGVCARRTEPLQQLAAAAPDRVTVAQIDVTADDSDVQFNNLADAMGGTDIVLYCAGCGWNNPELDPAKDTRTVNTNVVGFTRIVNAAFDRFARIAPPTRRRGQIAVITSIAGTRGIGISSTYSATKRYQWTYIESLSQLARVRRVAVDFTDIRPGFVDTPLLDTSAHRYPMLMTPDRVSRRIVRAILRRRHTVVIDSRWRCVTALWSLIPHCLWRRLKISF